MLDCGGDVAPVSTRAHPKVPASHASVQEHVDYALELMRRARDLVILAFAELTDDEKHMLERDLPSLAEKFKENLYLHEDEDQVRWKRTVLLDLIGDRLDPRPEFTRGRDKLLAGRRRDHVHFLKSV